MSKCYNAGSVTLFYNWGLKMKHHTVVVDGVTFMLYQATRELIRHEYDAFNADFTKFSIITRTEFHEYNKHYAYVLITPPYRSGPLTGFDTPEEALSDAVLNYADSEAVREAAEYMLEQDEQWEVEPENACPKCGNTDFRRVTTGEFDNTRWTCDCGQVYGGQ